MLAGCSPPGATSSSGGDPASGESAASESTETSPPTKTGKGASCSAELGAVVSPGQEATRLATSKYTAASIAPQILDAGFVYESLDEGLDVTVDTTDTVDTVETGEIAGSVGIDPILEAIGPYVGVHRDLQ